MASRIVCSHALRARAFCRQVLGMSWRIKTPYRSAQNSRLGSSGLMWIRKPLSPIVLVMTMSRFKNSSSGAV